MYNINEIGDGCAAKKVDSKCCVYLAFTGKKLTIVLKLYALLLKVEWILNYHDCYIFSYQSLFGENLIV